MADNKINYWAEWGSLIGFARHKGAIPWDDDMDFGLLDEDYDKLLSIKDKLKEFDSRLDCIYDSYAQYECWKTDGCWIITLKFQNRITFCDLCRYRVDIDEKGHKTVVYNKPDSRWL